MTTRKVALICVLVLFGFFAALTVDKSARAGVPNAAAALAAPATSPDTDVTDYNDWRFACTAGKDGQKDCRIFQKIVWNKAPGQTESLVVVIFPVAGAPEPKDKTKEKVTALVRLIAPLGADLRAGLALVVGTKNKDKPARLPYEVCRAAGCMIDIGVGATFIKSVKAADGILVAYREQGTKPTTLKVSVKGFAAAFDALAKTGHAKSKG